MNFKAEVVETPLLTKKEQSTLALIVEGHTGEQIAAFQDRSRRTVEGRVMVIKEKLHANNLHHLVAVAIAKGLVKIREVGKPFSAIVLLLLMSFQFEDNGCVRPVRGRAQTVRTGGGRCTRKEGV